MEEQSPSTQFTPERLAQWLAQWDGPKLGKHLRREMKWQAALLYEKVMILRLVDPNFERELEELGATAFLDRYTELLQRESQERAEQVGQKLGPVSTDPSRGEGTSRS